MESEKEWFYRRWGRRYGPFSSEEISELIATGFLDAKQKVWNSEGDRLTFVRATEVQTEDQR